MMTSGLIRFLSCLALLVSSFAPSLHWLSHQGGKDAHHSCSARAGSELSCSNGLVEQEQFGQIEKKVPSPQNILLLMPHVKFACSSSNEQTPTLSIITRGAQSLQNHTHLRRFTHHALQTPILSALTKLELDRFHKAFLNRQILCRWHSPQAECFAWLDHTTDQRLSMLLLCPKV